MEPGHYYHRWICKRISDLGVRQPVDVHPVPAVVLIGLLTILRIIGIDLTTLAVFAGAVGVGIGLGMRSLASNFISGLFLLIRAAFAQRRYRQDRPTRR